MHIKSEDRILLKKIISLFKPLRKKITMVILCIIFSSGINMVFPLLSKKVMDDGIVAQNFFIVVKYTLITFLAIICDQIIGFIQTKYFTYINSIFQYDLNKKAFKHLLRLRIDYFNNTNFAETINNIGMDVGNIARISDRSTFFIISQLFRAIGGLIGLVLINWKLTLLVMVIIPAKYFTVNYLSKKRIQKFRKMMEYTSDFSSWYGDTIAGIKEIKLFGIDRLKIGQFIKKQRQIIVTNIQLTFIDKINEYSEGIISQIISGTLYIVGSYLLFRGGISLGGLFAFIAYTLYVISPISAIINIGYSFSNLFPSAKRLFSFLETEVENDYLSSSTERLNELDGNIRFENVSFFYKNGIEILKNANFTIYEGEKVAIIGDNGAGKSTILNLLMRLYEPASGSIKIGEVDIRKIKLRNYRKIFSIVSQDIFLFNATIEENIMLGASLSRDELCKVFEHTDIMDFIKNMPQESKTNVGRNGSKLSGGQKQKIAMARAIAKKSKILIFDEVTSSLDINSQSYINDLIKDKLPDKTVLIVSHNMNVIKHVDRILLVSNGNILEVKKDDEHILNGSYEKLFDLKTEKNKVAI